MVTNEMTTRELRNATINLDELTKFGRFLLDGDFTAIFDEHSVRLYRDGIRYYTFNYRKHGVKYELYD